MNEMRWVLLGGAAIVMAMLVAWSMQSDTGPMPSARASRTASVVGATAEAPTATADEGVASPRPRAISGPINLRATYGNPLAAQPNHGKLVLVKREKEQKAAAPAGK